MAEFIELFKGRGNISFTGMRDTALALLPQERTKRNKLYQDLERGKGILDDEDHLNMYLHSYGKMHKAKLDVAFSSIPDISKIFSEEVEIYDWGCGQGTASVCLLDFLKLKKISPSIKQFCLIEPSPAAVNRATEVIGCINPAYKVNSIIKDFNSLIPEDFKKSSTRKIHLFSNILDVEAFDLAQFIHLFQNVFGDDNYFVCVGPYYSNNDRVDEFVAAIVPETVYATMNKERGTWQGDWTISMRIFFKHFDRVESIENIRKRIEDSHKKEQFFAGYILDSIAQEYSESDKKDLAESLYHSLSCFDVKSNIPLDYNSNADSKLAVLANIISRGLPTKAPILLENTFADIFHISTKPEEGNVLDYKSTHKVSVREIYEALHIIDPRFDVNFYNGDMLGSSFEKGFIESYLKGSPSEYLIQIFEPQRQLSSIVDIPDKKFSKDQRVDFALEIPYGEARTGFILEMDGSRYHSNIFSRINDERRDRMSLQGGWDTYRIEQLNDMAFMKNWETDAASVEYLKIIKSNFEKKLNGQWLNTLQIVLAPLAIARVERMLVEAMMSGAISLEADVWSIAVVERDIPCAALAIKDLREKYEHICELAGSEDKMPKIQLSIVSTDEFKDSPLHLGNKVITRIPEDHFDLCIDISMLLRDNIDALPLNVDTDTIYLIRSSHYKKRERTICTAENIQYPPLVNKDGTGSYTNIEERENVLDLTS
jgi:ATP-dependent DNA helicase RecQ